MRAERKPAEGIAVGDQPNNVRDIVNHIKNAPDEGLAELIERYGSDPRSGVQRALDSARHRLEKRQELVEHTRSLYTEQRKQGGEGLVVGLDEVGRGAIAGPLTVAAVCLPAEPMVIGIDDSKKLTPARREELARQIRECAVAIGISHIPPDEIDEYGMAFCLRKAMLEALEDTGIEPDAVLIDGNPLHLHAKEKCIVKGDGKIASIAAASIIAKVTRDRLMTLSEDDYPGYTFAASKGYASPEHIQAIRDKGLSDFHRKTFCNGLINEQMTLL